MSYFEIKEIDFLGSVFVVNNFKPDNFPNRDRLEMLKSVDLSYPIFFDEVSISPNITLFLSDIKGMCEVYFSFCHFQSSFKFFDLSFKYIRFQNCVFDSDSISFNNNIFCDFHFFSIEKQFELILYNSYELNINLVNVNFHKVDISLSKKIGLSAYGNTTPSNFIFNYTDLISLSFHNIVINECFFDMVSFSSIRLFSCDIIEKLEFFSFDYEEPYKIESIILLSINGSEIDLSNVDDRIFVKNFFISSSSNVNVNKINIDSLILRDNCSKLSFNNLFVNSIQFNSFLSINHVIFRNVVGTYSGNLSLSGSILKDVTFNPSFLHQFQVIDVRNSSIEGLEVYNFMYIPDHCILNNESLEEDNIGLCRELVGLMIDHNHKYYATNYNALEQNLRLKSGVFNSMVDKYVLWLNKYSNNHATKPEYSLRLILFLFFAYFFLLNFDVLYCLGSLMRYNLYIPFDLMFENFSVFFNPLKGIKDIDYPDYNPSKLFIIWDFFYNVIYAYLVYQFVAAFRKFNKS